MRIGLFAFALLGVATAAHQRRATVPYGWRNAGRPDVGKPITLQVGLRQQNLGELEDRLYAVSTPGHEDYGRHLGGNEVNAMVKPKAETHDAVMAWLRHENVTRFRSDGHWITFATTIGSANRLLDADFCHYTSAEGDVKLRTTRYSVPDAVAEHVDLVHPTTYFGKTTAHAPRNQIWKKPQAIDAPIANSSCAQLLTPQCIEDIYNIHYTPKAKSGSTIAFGNFLNQTPLYSDLALYERRFGLPSQNFSVELINNGVNNQTADSDNNIEADLDVQNIVAVSNPLPVTAYITGGSPPFIPNLDEPVLNTNEPYLEFYNYLLAKPNAGLPHVISNSYGDDEQTVPLEYAKRVCDQIMQLTARGVSILESSGDTGVGSACRANDGSNATQFTPIFPATCPYITAVGGTQGYPPVQGWTGSSGGFSNYFKRPAYQETAVQDYLANHISAATRAYYEPYTNFSGRGFPDLAAQSVSPRYAVVLDGRNVAVGGTSAASPTVAGIVALLNDARLRAGLPVLGFLNPRLYSSDYKSFLDITQGGSLGCGGVNLQTGDPVPGGGVIPYASWNCTPGWDPVTGWGTPNFQKWKRLVLSQYPTPAPGQQPH